MFNYQSFRTGPICFGHFQIIKTNPEKSNLNLDKMIWTQPKRSETDQNDLYLSKTIWTVQNYFEPIEGQVIRQLTGDYENGLISAHSRYNENYLAHYFI